MGYKSFENSSCEFYPCHKGVKGEFNCLFCFCPLYSLGDSCGGDFVYLESGVKDCSHCDYPHRGEEGHDFVVERLKAISKDKL